MTYPWPIFSILVYFLVGSPTLTICPALEIHNKHMTWSSNSKPIHCIIMHYKMEDLSSLHRYQPPLHHIINYPYIIITSSQLSLHHLNYHYIIITSSQLSLHHLNYHYIIITSSIAITSLCNRRHEVAYWGVRQLLRRSFWVSFLFSVVAELGFPLSHPDWRWPCVCVLEEEG